MLNRLVDKSWFPRKCTLYVAIPTSLFDVDPAEGDKIGEARMLGNDDGRDSKAIATSDVARGNRYKK